MTFALHVVAATAEEDAGATATAGSATGAVGSLGAGAEGAGPAAGSPPSPPVAVGASVCCAGGTTSHMTSASFF
ncbi:MAG TPA: hypothetical protein VF587_18885 [Solirubrobacteraceae bacterium]